MNEKNISFVLVGEECVDGMGTMAEIFIPNQEFFTSVFHSKMLCTVIHYNVSYCKRLFYVQIGENG